MREYKFVQMKYKMMKGGYVTSKEDGYRNHRTVIREMAQQGYRFVGRVPVDADGYGRETVFDLVCEREDNYGGPKF